MIYFAAILWRKNYRNIRSFIIINYYKIKSFYRKSQQSCKNKSIGAFQKFWPKKLIPNRKFQTWSNGQKFDTQIEMSMNSIKILNFHDFDDSMSIWPFFSQSLYPTRYNHVHHWIHSNRRHGTGRDSVQFIKQMNF